MYVNLILKAGFQLFNYSSLNEKLFFNKEILIENENYEIFETQNISYYKGQVIDISNNYKIDKKNFHNYFNLIPNNKKYVYLLRINDVIKIGRTSNLLKRINEIVQYNFESPFYFTYMLVNDHIFHEKQLHLLYDHLKIKGEKFKWDTKSLTVFKNYQKKMTNDSWRGLTFFV